MKTKIFLFLTITAALTLSSCDTKERDPFISKEESKQIFVVTEVGDITSENISTLHFFDEKQLQAAQSNSAFLGFKLVLMNEKFKDLLSKLDEKEAPQVKNSAVAFMIYEGELKVFTVHASGSNRKLEKMNETFPTDRTEISTVLSEFKTKKEFSLRELKLQKRIMKEQSFAKIQQMIAEHNEGYEQKDLEKVSGSTTDLRLFLVASFKIDMQGILDKQETDYKEKKSAITVMEQNPELATHLKITGTRTDKAPAEENEKK